MSEDNFGWQTLSDDVEALASRNERRAKGHHVSTQMQWAAMQALKRGARQRGISIEGYARRAICAQLCRDLGLSWSELMAQEPATSGFGLTRYGAERRAGTGFGVWP